MNEKYSRRTFIKNTALITSFTMLPPLSAFTSDKNKAFYMDGLTFIPESLELLKESGLNAFIADVSAGESVIEEDGTSGYRRTFEACLNSITAQKRRLEKKNQFAFLATKGVDFDNAVKSGKTAIFFQFQGVFLLLGVHWNIHYSFFFYYLTFFYNHL